VLAFTDMQGRWRASGCRRSSSWRRCRTLLRGLQLPARRGRDMNTVDGYAMSSWDRGYGDFVMAPDMSTLRRIPCTTAPSW